LKKPNNKNTIDVPSNYRELVQALQKWFRNNKRELPWRKTNNPYHILISEVMLQQTQVVHVIPKYEEFLGAFPSISHLASASKADVLKIWSGLGYNSRALRLHQLATTVMNQYGGELPTTAKELEQLPGIGRYTASAVASFAFKERVPIVDTNIQRIFGRAFPTLKSKHDVWEIAYALLPKKQSDSWNQALMELGSLICTSAFPKCDLCPWSNWCPRHVISPTKKKIRKSEPLFLGIPHRIYRGKIVKLLIQHDSLTPRKLLQLLSLNSSHLSWLMRLLRQMEKDGLLQIQQRASHTSISLPK